METSGFSYVGISVITTISFFIRYSIALKNSFSVILSLAHHPALFLIQDGITSCAVDEGIVYIPVRKTTKTKNNMNFMSYTLVIV